MDLVELARRYVGHYVRIATHGHVRMEGILASVHDDCLRLTDALTLSELEDQGWFGKLRRADDDLNYGAREPESLIHIHGVQAITCLDEDLAPLEKEVDEPSLSRKAVVIVNGKVTASAADEPDEDEPTERAWERRLDTDRITLEIGVNLIRLADPKRGGDLLERVIGVRESIAEELGVLTPRVRIRDNVRMGTDEYCIYLSGVEAARGAIDPDRLLAMSAGEPRGNLAGVPTNDPAFGLPALWIGKGQGERAEMLGYTVVQPSAVIATHLKEIVKHHAPDLLSFEHVGELVSRLRLTDPVLIEESIPSAVSIRTLHFVLRRLLAEGVAIKHVSPIIECLAHEASHVDDLVVLVERVRRRIAAAIRQPFRRADDGRVKSVVLGDTLTDEALSRLARPTAVDRRWCERLAAELRHQCRFYSEDEPAAVVVEDTLRLPLSELLNRGGHRIAVLARSELVDNGDVHAVATIADLQLQVAESTVEPHEMATPRRPR